MAITTEGVIAILSFIGLLLSIGWNVKNLNRTNKQEITERASKDANIENAMNRTSTDIAEIKADVKSIDKKFESIAKRQTETEKEVAIAKRDIETAFTRIDEIKQK